MDIKERILIIVLRVTAVLTMTAFFAVIMPFDWMAKTNDWLGLQKLENTPLTGYLTRSLSLIYVINGALVLYLSFDVRRYKEVIRFMGFLCIPFGISIICIDCSVQMPLYWKACEGAFTIVTGLVILWLVRNCNKMSNPSS